MRAFWFQTICADTKLTASILSAHADLTRAVCTVKCIYVYVYVSWNGVEYIVWDLDYHTAEYR